MIQVGEVYNNVHGKPFIVTEYQNAHNIKVKFIYTGGVVNTQSSSILTGSVKDIRGRAVHGIGFLGKAGYAVEYRRLYVLWKSLLTHYVEDTSGLKLTSRWDDFSNFVNDVNESDIDFGIHPLSNLYDIDNDTFDKENIIFVKQPIYKNYVSLTTAYNEGLDILEVDGDNITVEVYKSRGTKFRTTNISGMDNAIRFVKENRIKEFSLNRVNGKVRDLIDTMVVKLKERHDV